MLDGLSLLSATSTAFRMAKIHLFNSLVHIFWLSLFFVIVVGTHPIGLVAQSSQTGERTSINEIPSPRPGGWITDLTGRVSPEAVEHINMVCQEINDRMKREMCVVVISSIGQKSEGGRDSAHRKYATNLFNLWQVGSASKFGLSGIWGDNGVLLFVALDDKAAEIILGDGIDGREEERIADQIVQNVVVENFLNDDPHSALYEGIRAVATRIYAVADLDSPVMLPSVSDSGKKVIKGRRRRQRGPIAWFPWILGGAGVGGVGLLVGGRYYMRYRPRHCPSCSDEMIRLTESQDDTFLEDPEQIEEQLGSVDYDVWGCAKCEEILKIRYGKLFTRYSKCPKCWYVTVLKVQKVLRRATYTSGGRVRVVEDCKSCNYRKVYTYRTPKKVKSSSGKSSFGSSSGGGFSSGRSSGFGGGRSSGGGASGRW